MTGLALRERVPDGAGPRLPQRPRQRLQPSPARPQYLWLLVVFLSSGAIARLTLQARVAQLEAYKRDLETLITTEKIAYARELQQFEQLTSADRLAPVVAQQGLGAPLSFVSLSVGPLPPPRIHWELPADLETPLSVEPAQWSAFLAPQDETQGKGWP